MKIDLQQEKVGDKTTWEDLARGCGQVIAMSVVSMMRFRVAMSRYPAGKDPFHLALVKLAPPEEQIDAYDLRVITYPAPDAADRPIQRLSDVKNIVIRDGEPHNFVVFERLVRRWTGRSCRPWKTHTTC